MRASLEEWLLYLKYTMTFQGKYYHPILNQIQISGKDLITEFDHEGEPYFSLRRYSFFYEDGRAVDMRDYLPDMLSICDARKKRKERIPLRGPVPGTGVKSKKIRGCLRHVKTSNEIRWNSAPEIADYVRPARRKGNLPTLYSDIFRVPQRSWKEQGKYRHQWEKGIRN